jgi:hypothetical protein
MIANRVGVSPCFRPSRPCLGWEGRFYNTPIVPARASGRASSPRPPPRWSPRQPQSPPPKPSRSSPPSLAANSAQLRPEVDRKVRDDPLRMVPAGLELVPGPYGLIGSAIRLLNVSASSASNSSASIRATSDFNSGDVFGIVACIALASATRLQKLIIDVDEFGRADQRQSPPTTSPPMTSQPAHSAARSTPSSAAGRRSGVS